MCWIVGSDSFALLSLPTDSQHYNPAGTPEQVVKSPRRTSFVDECVSRPAPGPVLIDLFTNLVNDSTYSTILRFRNSCLFQALYIYGADNVWLLSFIEFLHRCIFLLYLFPVLLPPVTVFAHNIAFLWLRNSKQMTISSQGLWGSYSLGRRPGDYAGQGHCLKQ